MANEKRYAQANNESLHRIFTIPEAPDSTLSQIESEISKNLNGFLSHHIVATDKPLSEIEQDFASSELPERPEYVSDHTRQLLEKLIAQSVHTSAPSFIGHMTSALPYFLLPLSKLMVGLNQNLVKIETSKAFTPMERQVLGMMHRLVYANNDDFYQDWMHSADSSLGAFCSGGTVANITALWVARNSLLVAKPGFKGVSEEGLFKGLKAYGYDDLAILVSERGHYSLKKAANLLGLGHDSIIAIPTDAEHRMDCKLLREKCAELEAKNIKVMAIVGIAGTTETGTLDPLNDMADIAAEYNAHFHVDAAWGGATLFSNKYRYLLSGIERADSVTIDAHKQMYVPMGAGLVLFKNPEAVAAIEHHAEYILRKGSKDLGSHTLEGSRPGMAMLLYASLHIISRPGFELLINQSIEKAKYFASLITAHEDFQLVSEPKLCLLTYRYVPKHVQELLQSCTLQQRRNINELLDQLTITMQKLQREAGKSFVSRTRIPEQGQGTDAISVFRVVLANPLTTEDILQQVLVEQEAIATEQTPLLAQLQSIIDA
ncbi:pyridoxal-dependent aspartate 1-decarboxylase PanP [Thalassotalea mangrovi]|uniref:Putative pyridoxal-dependent aspartate 1-decarboxylase n=1 Tax=Thalassotalea mangrovi TaxID=2572245 RepID=A0A4U1B4P9_9GAMM|nr:putative pyridoxal-dependent aspartate 1-decarboxylase [Thalassotalea mangrovi]TKB45360.1 putative pyridoxal-dependent aspartate 1-decarboxylase [Thalassotalea mangrovi]